MDGRSESKLSWKWMQAFLLVGGCMTVFAVAERSLKAQTELFHATGPLPSYEVATIKLIGSVPVMGGGGAPNIAHFRETTRDLITDAYNAPFHSDRVIGGPKWLDDNDYNIDAKIPDDILAAEQKMTKEDRQKQNRMMDQSLLRDRFKLKMHFEMRDMSVYELEVTKDGPKVAPAKDSGPPPPPPGVMNVIDPKTMRQGIMVLKKSSGMEMTARNVTLSQAFQAPVFELGRRPIVNKTGLTGKYDFTLDWTPDQPTVAGPDGVTPSSMEDRGPSFFTAVQEQLGLRFVPSKASIEVIVIDSIELPSEN